MKDLLLAIVILALMVSGASLGERTEMTLAEKLANNQPLDAQEEQRLDMALRNLDILGSWIGSDMNPRLRSFYAEQGAFGIMPNGGSYYYSSAPQAIGNASATPVTLTVSSETAYGNDWVVRLDSADNTKLVWNPSVENGSNIVMVSGSATFESNATGKRDIYMRIYNVSDDSLEASYNLVTGDARNGNATQLNFNMPFILYDGFYGKVEAYQNSGGNLNLTFFRIAVFAIR